MQQVESGKRKTAQASKLVSMLGQIGKVLELTAPWGAPQHELRSSP